MMTKDTKLTPKNRAVQLDFEGNPATPKSKAASKVKRLNLPNLTQRDFQLLMAINSHGGVLNTVQISTKFWPPDLHRRLTHWGLSPDQSKAWLVEHDWAVLWDITEQIKWGRKLNRIRVSEKLSKANQRLIAQLEQLDVVDRQSLVSWLDVMDNLPSHEWLNQTIAQQVAAPQAYINRSRLPNEVVSSACKARLSYLAKQGLIEAYEQPTRLSDGRAQACWFLTRQGRNLIAQIQGVRPTEVDWKPAGSYGNLHLPHRLVINDLRIAFDQACQRHGYQIRQWIDDNQLKKLLAKEKVKLIRLVHDPQTGEANEVEESHTLKIPDSYVWLDLGAAGQRHCFIEFDNQTLTQSYSDGHPKDFAAKIRTLSAFYRSGQYNQMFPEAGDSLWLLTITSGSQRRRANLMQTAKRVIGQNNRALDRYWFACLDDIPTWQNPFSSAVFAPIWLRAGDKKTWQLDEQR